MRLEPRRPATELAARMALLSEYPRFSIEFATALHCLELLGLAPAFLLNLPASLLVQGMTYFFRAGFAASLAFASASLACSSLTLAASFLVSLGPATLAIPATEGAGVTCLS